MPLSTRTRISHLQDKKAVSHLAMVILDIVAIIAILSLVLLGDFFEAQNAVEIDNTGKQVYCSYGQCFFVESVKNPSALQPQYGTQGVARVNP